MISNRPSVARDLELSPSAKKVLLHLQQTKTVSPMEGQVVLGMPKVARQIHELREAGYPIGTDYKKDGQGKRYARYHYGIAA